MRTIAITGSSGLVGSALARKLSESGDRVVHLSRRASNPSPHRVEKLGEARLLWDPERGIFPAAELEGIDALIHLAGEPLASLRWTAAKKARILQSREAGTELVARSIAGMDRPPQLFLSASAVGFYGDRGHEDLTEESSGGTGFLAEVCRRWEGAATPARQAGIRTVFLRTGFVLARDGGALPPLLLPFRVGVGGRIGGGEQYMSWIDLEDEIGLILHALATPALEGAMNATAPRPVTNAEFTRALGRVLNRPTLLPLPAPLVRLGLGEMGEDLLLAGQRALPERARASGYAFFFEEVEGSLRNQLRRGARKASGVKG